MEDERSNMINVFIGYDPVESVAWHAMAHSLIEHSSQPLAITPINLRNLGSIFRRERDQKQSNEFSISRFLVPYLCDYKGIGLFFDCDMMVRCDIAPLVDAVNSAPEMAVHVVQHDYTPRDGIKYLNTVQHAYPRKNWSSVVAWNCAHPANRAVTLDFVHSASPLELHRFTWLADDQIGALDRRWNWLVGEYDNPDDSVCNVHWTVGGPYFTEYRDADFAGEWFALRDRMNFCQQRA